MYPAFMSPYKSTVVEVPVEKLVYISGPSTGMPLGTKLSKIITVKSEFINIARKKHDKHIEVKLGEIYVNKSKR
jgi:hypothetical protein